MRKEIQLLEFKNKKILFFDFSDCKKEDIKLIIDDAKQWFQGKQQNSILTLTDVTNTRYDAETLNLFKDFTLHNKPYVLAAAVVGITSPLMKLAYNFVMAVSKRNVPIFDTREQAMEWLIGQ